MPSEQPKNNEHRWPRKSAGRKMIKDVPIVGTNFTLAEVKSLIEKGIKKFDTINYIYIVDDNKKLTGVFSIKDLYEFPHDTKVEKISTKPPLLTVYPDTNQELAAVSALRRNIKAVPVIDRDGTFLGVIPSDTILSIIYKEAREDLLRMAGVHPNHSDFDNVLEIPFFTAIKHRIPWLIIGLFGGVFAANIINNFEIVLKNNLILAAFIPLIVYMSDAVGTQMEAFIVRDLVVSHKFKFLRYFLKQLNIVIIISILFGGILIGINKIIGINSNVSFVLSISLSFAIISSVFTGLLIPYIFSRLKIDPANASGPIATIIQDILSVTIYFLIAGALL